MFPESYVRNFVYNRKKQLVMFGVFFTALCVLIGRLIFLVVVKGPRYEAMAKEQQQRERVVYSPRGAIVDRNGVVLADNKRVYNISVIHNQITDPEAVIQMLAKECGLDEAFVRKRVEKVSSIEKIKYHVDEEVGKRVLSYGYDGVKVDGCYSRDYPYEDLASKVLGFTGGDNQGILGLEAKYDEVLRGNPEELLTMTDARGVEVEQYGEIHTESEEGNTLITTLDYNIQSYCAQEAKKAMIRKEAEGVSILVMNPQNGEILAMVDEPEYNLNDPFTLTEWYQGYEGTQGCNLMWRNGCVSDTYEPGSIFKIITSCAAFEEGVLTPEDRFFCPGYTVVEDRRIRCHKTTGHGSESYVEALENSCNPAFVQIGSRVGAERFYHYFEQFGLLDKTGIDLPGEASTIMHKPENIHPVELATISFGQSFQVSPIEMMTVIASFINGGNRVTPHLAKGIQKPGEQECYQYQYPVKTGICSSDTSEKMRTFLEKVVSEGGGNKAYIEGYSIGGKTATSQTLPRSEHQYVSSFVGFAPAANPEVMVLVIIKKPQGIYYGGTICAPVAREIFANILPYLGIDK